MFLPGEFPGHHIHRETTNSEVLRIRIRRAYAVDLVGLEGTYACRGRTGVFKRAPPPSATTSRRRDVVLRVTRVTGDFL